MAPEMLETVAALPLEVLEGSVIVVRAYPVRAEIALVRKSSSEETESGETELGCTVSLQERPRRWLELIASASTVAFPLAASEQESFVSSRGDRFKQRFRVVIASSSDSVWSSL